MRQGEHTPSSASPLSAQFSEMWAPFGTLLWKRREGMINSGTDLVVNDGMT